MSRDITDEMINHRIDELYSRYDFLIQREDLKEEAMRDLRTCTKYETPQAASDEEVVSFMKRGLYQNVYRRNRVAWIKNDDNAVFLERFETAKTVLAYRRQLMGGFSNRIYQF